MDVEYIVFTYLVCNTLNLILFGLEFSLVEEVTEEMSL